MLRRNLKFFVGKLKKPNLRTLRELIEAGKLMPAIDRVYSFAEIQDVLPTMGEGHVQGKLVVRIDERKRLLRSA